MKKKDNKDAIRTMINELIRIDGFEFVCLEGNILGFMLPKPDLAVLPYTASRAGYKNGYATAFGLSDRVQKEAVEDWAKINDFFECQGFEEEITFADERLPKFTGVSVEGAITVGFDVLHFESKETAGTQEQCVRHVKTMCAALAIYIRCIEESV